MRSGEQRHTLAVWGEAPQTMDLHDHGWQVLWSGGGATVGGTP